MLSYEFWREFCRIEAVVAIKVAPFNRYQTLDVIHEAHVEAPENGTHQIVIQNQAGCTVDDVFVAGQPLPNTGPQTVIVKISPSYKNITIFVDVNCN